MLELPVLPVMKNCPLGGLITCWPGTACAVIVAMGTLVSEGSALQVLPPGEFAPGGHTPVYVITAIVGLPLPSFPTTQVTPAAGTQLSKCSVFNCSAAAHPVP